jgi:hypothetical protein
MSVFRKMVAGAMLAAALAVSGCGGDSVDTSTGASPDNEQSFEDAMVSYSACMREHGVDMPDPTFDGKGGSMIMRTDSATGDGDAAPAFGGPDDETFKAAAEACQPIMDEVEQNMPKLSAEEEAKMRDNALKFAQCMREHGVDMPDPTFDAGGKSSVIIQGGGKGDDTGSPIDVDKFNEAATACQGEGFGGGFSVSSGDGSGARVGIAASEAGK